MNNLRLHPAFKYQFDWILKYAVVIMGIVAVVAILINVFFAFNVVSGVFRIDVGSFMSVTFFVVGIVGIREDLRFFIQHGMGRRTAAISNLCGSLLAGVIIGLMGAILNLIFAWITTFPFLSLRFSENISFFPDWIIQALYLVFAWQFGVMISLIYYRLNSYFWKVIVSVAGGAAILFFGIGALVTIPINPTPLMSAGNPGSLIPIIAAMGAFCFLCSFLLIRRAQAR